MAFTSVYRSLIAALAAVSIMVLSACGGGEEVSQAQAKGVEVVAVAPVPAKADTKRILAAAPAKEATGFQLTAQFSQSTPAPQARSSALVAASAYGIEALLDWAERTYPELFPTHVETLFGCYQEKCYHFRPYPNGYFTAVREDNTVWGLGDYVGSNEKPYYFGTLEEFRCRVDVDSCRPYVQTFAPENNATNVPAKGTVAVFTYNEALNCSGVGGTGEIGSDIKIIVTVTCNSAAKTVSVAPVDSRWPFGSSVTLTIGGIRNLAGYPSLSASMSFTTSRPAVTSTKVFVANITPEQPAFTKAAAVVDTATSGVTLLQFPGGILNEVASVMVDGPTGKAWFGPRITRAAYGVDLETNQVSMVNIDPSRPDYNHGIQALALTDTELCYALGLRIDGYYMHNVLQCHSKMTGKVSFTSPVNWLGTSSDVAMQLRYLPYGNDKKLYALVTPFAALYVEDLGQGGFRAGCKPGPGFKGTVLEIDAVTRQVKTFVVGSVPQDIARDPKTGDLYVINTGDHSLSIITYTTGQVRTVPLATFTGREQPRRIIIDSPRDRFYVSDDVGDFVEMGRVVVYRLSTLEVMARVPVRRMPIGMAMTGNLLYVSSSWQSSVDVVNLDELTVVKTITGVGTNPEDVAVYVK